jgi:NADPH:quinone reductase
VTVRAVVYSEQGGPDVLRLVDRPMPEPGPGQVRVRVAVSGVNPTDWKSRQGGRGPLAFAAQVPNQDGAGTIDAVGADVPADRVGERVWLWEAAWQRADGTAQEFVVLPERHAIALPDEASFDLGASLGIPALTAHRCLTTAEGADGRLHPGSLTGRTVLVAGGAGAVGHAAIELARWAGATVLTTVSGPDKARLAAAAGAHEVINYRGDDVVEKVRRVATGGVDIVVEVSPAANAAINHAVLASGGTVAAYATESTADLALAVWPLMAHNVRYQFVLTYTVPAAAKAQAVADVAAAVAAGALRVGDEAGLPLHHYPLAEAAAAHAAVQDGAVGKVLITVG